jgi:hypothetical protein
MCALFTAAWPERLRRPVMIGHGQLQPRDTIITSLTPQMRAENAASGDRYAAAQMSTLDSEAKPSQ